MWINKQTELFSLLFIYQNPLKMRRKEEARRQSIDTGTQVSISVCSRPLGETEQCTGGEARWADGQKGIYLCRKP